MTDTLAPPPEQLAKGRWSRPKTDRRKSQAAYRRESVLERLKVSDEYKAAGLRLLRHKEGAEGVDVRWDEAPRGWHIPGDEFRVHVHGRELREAKQAVNSPLAWSGLITLVEDQHELPDIGRLYSQYKDKASATAWAHGMLSAGLSSLAFHWGLIRTRPPD